MRRPIVGGKRGSRKKDASFARGIWILHCQHNTFQTLAFYIERQADWKYAYAPHAQSSGTDKDITVTVPSFFEMGAKVSYLIPIRKDVKLQLNVGVQNMFNRYQSDLDKGYKRDSEYTYGPEMPRSFFGWERKFPYKKRG